LEQKQSTPPSNPEYTAIAAAPAFIGVAAPGGGQVARRITTITLRSFRGGVAAEALS